MTKTLREKQNETINRLLAAGLITESERSLYQTFRPSYDLVEIMLAMINGEIDVLDARSILAKMR